MYIKEDLDDVIIVIKFADIRFLTTLLGSLPFDIIFRDFVMIDLGDLQGQNLEQEPAHQFVSHGAVRDCLDAQITEASIRCDLRRNSPPVREGLTANHLGCDVGWLVISAVYFAGKLGAQRVGQVMNVLLAS